jgi:cation transport protein ChaC
MWNPIFSVAESCVARINGHHRSFCLRSTVGRGSPERPGLMLGLDGGGSSTGLALRIREPAGGTTSRCCGGARCPTGSYVPKWLLGRAAPGDVRVLAFAADRRADNYVGGLPEEEVARLLSTGAGFLKTYLDISSGRTAACCGTASRTATLAVSCAVVRITDDRMKVRSAFRPASRR